MFLLSVVAGPAASVIYWLGYSWRPASRAKTWAKALPLGILFVWLWVFAEDVGDSPIPWVILFACFGDIALSRDGNRWFLAGMGSFAIAHLALIAVFFDLGVSARSYPLGGALGLFVLAAGLGAALWTRAGALRGPVLGYCAVITVMALCGLGIDSGSARVDQTVLWGVALFVLSDALIAAQLFLAPKARRVQVALSLAIWPPYYLAMVFFAAAAPG